MSDADTLNMVLTVKTKQVLVDAAINGINVVFVVAIWELLVPQGTTTHLQREKDSTK